MKEKLTVSVLGGGSWATAIVKVLQENCNTIGWYMRNESAIEHIKKNAHNPNFLSAAELDTEKIFISSDINKIVEYGDILIFAIPSPYFHSALITITSDFSSKIVVSAIKGIIPESSLIATEHIHKHSKVPRENLAIIVGPCHAEEVAMEKLSYLSVACIDKAKAKMIKQLVNTHFINVKTSDDIIGTEYAATLKNVFAIAMGIAHGLGYGDNYLAVLLSNSIREMKRFIRSIHKMKRNINSTLYLGDLLVTSYSVFSRNRMMGNMIGKGYTIKSTIMEMNMVAEGYYATKSVYQLTQEKKTKTPIISAVYEVLYEKKDPKKVFEKLSEKLN